MLSVSIDNNDWISNWSIQWKSRRRHVMQLDVALVTWQTYLIFLSRFCHGQWTSLIRPQPKSIKTHHEVYILMQLIGWYVWMNYDFAFGQSDFYHVVERTAIQFFITWLLSNHYFKSATRKNYHHQTEICTTPILFAKIDYLYILDPKLLYMVVQAFRLKNTRVT